jgi:hypothetical protein
MLARRERPRKRLNDRANCGDLMIPRRAAVSFSLWSGCL